MKEKTTFALIVVLIFMGNLFGCKNDSTKDKGPFTVTFNTNGGTPADIASETVNAGESLGDRFPSNPTMDEKEFSGWYEEDQFVGDNAVKGSARRYTATTPITKNVNLKALWYRGSQNPILPYWEYIPDGEPYIFEDPDNPGRYRLYLYGSHDSIWYEEDANNYCGRRQYAWSAPLEDLTDWSRKLCFVSDKNRDGVPFAQPDVLYAPDILEYIDPATKKKTYYFFPNNQSRISMVCKSDRPDGPFEVINWSEADPDSTVGPMGFDPAAFQDPKTGKVWGYWGFTEAYLAELDPSNNFTAEVPETRIDDFIPGSSEGHGGGSFATDPQGFNYFEAPSMRFIQMNGQEKYVLVYSRRGVTSAGGYPVSERWGNTNSLLSYAYADAPNGPWTYGGTIIYNGSELGATSNSYAHHNNHGGLVEINGQWYIFYHRCINGHGFSRQACVEPVTIYITPDGKVIISEVEPTSMGFDINGLNPYRKLSAGSACYHSSGFIIPSRDQDINNNWFNITGNNTIGFKTFNFNDRVPAGKNRYLSIFVTPGTRGGTVTVYKAPEGTPNITQGEVIGTIEVTANGPEKYTITTPEIDELYGKWNIYFRFAPAGGSGSMCLFEYMQFSLE